MKERTASVQVSFVVCSELVEQGVDHSGFRMRPFGNLAYHRRIAETLRDLLWCSCCILVIHSALDIPD